jgi:hypothetical protein
LPRDVGEINTMRMANIKSVHLDASFFFDFFGPAESEKGPSTGQQQHAV